MRRSQKINSPKRQLKHIGEVNLAGNLESGPYPNLALPSRAALAKGEEVIELVTKPGAGHPIGGTERGEDEQGHSSDGAKF